MEPAPVPEPVGRFAAELDREVRSVVGDRLLSTIVHGSAALGGFMADRSDVDMLMIAVDELDAQLLHRTAERVRGSAPRCPGVGIELSVVTAAAAADPQSPWPYLLHVATGRGDAKTVLGADHDGDDDLLMHYAVCRAAGVAATGPPPSELIGQIGRDEILDYLTTELSWAIEHAGTAYSVLNACRAWRFAATGGLVSKLEGASWALQAGAPEALVESAIAAQTGVGDPPPDGDTCSFVALVQTLIRNADRVSSTC